MKHTGIPLGKSVRVRNGKLERVHTYRSASAAIGAKKKKRIVPAQRAMHLPAGKK